MSSLLEWISFLQKWVAGDITMSGTSMAAPYVTAAAANVRQLHPDWSAFEIRDALIAATKDLGSPIFSQGKGKVDTSKVNGVKSFATPATLSFGFDNSSTGEWSHIDTISFTNVSPSPRTYTFKYVSSYGGIDLQISPTATILSSNETKSIVVDLSVNNSQIPDNTVLPQGYGGTILAISNNDTVAVPYVFFKGSVFQLTFSETPFQVVIHDRKSNSVLLQSDKFISYSRCSCGHIRHYHGVFRLQPTSSMKA